MAQLVYRGILSGYHSWAVVGTELCNALYNLGYDISVQSTNGTKGMSELLKGLVYKSPAKPPIGLSYSIPRNIRLINADRKVVIYNYEATKLPPGWAKDLSSADLLLPSSTFARDIFIQNGVSKDKVEVLSHGVDIRRYNPNIVPMNLGNKKFKFLCVAEPHARKGFELLLQAYAEEFASTEDVMLVIKTSLKNVQRAYYEIDIRDYLKRFQKSYAMAEVKLLIDKYDSLGPLYTACNAFVLPSRSECFCLPVLEAMACKIPVITTGYGGQMDFANKSNSYLLSYKIIDAPRSMQYWHYDEHSKISAPDVQHLRTLMRHVYKNYVEAQEKAELAYQQVIPKYTWESVAEQLVDMMQARKWRETTGLRKVRVTPEKIEATLQRAVELEEQQEKRLQSALTNRQDRITQLQTEIATRQAEINKLAVQAEVAVDETKYKRLTRAFSGKVTIIVLNYNTKKALQNCIDSIKVNTTNADYELIVIDNGSTDGSVEYLKAVPGIRAIFNGVNVGVAKGWNQGIAVSDPNTDIVVLNSDIITVQNWLKKLNRVAYEDLSIGVVGCRIKGLGAQKNYILHTGAMIQRNGMGQENEWGIPLVDYGQCQVNKKAQIVVGACMYLKRELLDVIGVFDERYTPAYFEDSDMCLKISEAGYKVYYCGEVTLLHEHGATSKTNNINVAHLLETNRKKFTEKWQLFLSKKEGHVEIRGPIYGPSGYAEACRNLAQGLWEANVDVVYKPITSHPSEQKRKSNFLNIICREAIENPLNYDTCVVFYLADFFIHNFANKKRRIGYTMLEVDGVPGSWVQYCNNHLTELWVPSTFNQGTFKRSGVKIPIHVVPLGVDTDRFNPHVRPLIPRNGKLRFLCVCEMGERKNVHLLMRAFQAEFGKMENVELLLKIANNDPSINVEKELAQYDLRSIMLLTQFYDVHQMPSLFASADCFVLPSSGEGWGLPYAEAMACGLPTIGTNWSANTDFMKPDNSYLIKVEKLVPAIARCPLYAGFNWALPDVKHLRQLMREVYENQAAAKQIGQKASEHILHEYSLVKVAEIAKKRLLG